MFKPELESAPSEERVTAIPALNLVHINFKDLERTLRFYEDDRYGFMDEVPRLRP